MFLRKNVIKRERKKEEKENANVCATSNETTFETGQEEKQRVLKVEGV